MQRKSRRVRIYENMIHMLGRVTAAEKAGKPLYYDRSAITSQVLTTLHNEDIQVCSHREDYSTLRLAVRTIHPTRSEHPSRPSLVIMTTTSGPPQSDSPRQDKLIPTRGAPPNFQLTSSLHTEHLSRPPGQRHCVPLAPRAASSRPTQPAQATTQPNCKQNPSPITCVRPFCSTPRSSLPTPVPVWPSWPSPASRHTSSSSSWRTISRTGGLFPRASPHVSGSPLCRTRLPTMTGPVRAQVESPHVHYWPCGQQACGGVRASGCAGLRRGLLNGTWKARANAGALSKNGLLDVR